MFRAGGRIIAREVDLRAQVTAGQVLARLDPADLTLAVRSATADLASAEAQAAQAAAERVRADLPVGIEMQQIADEVGADALRV